MVHWRGYKFDWRRTLHVIFYSGLHFTFTSVGHKIIETRGGDNVFWPANGILAAGILNADTLILKFLVILGCSTIQAFSYQFWFQRQLFWILINIFEACLMGFGIQFLLRYCSQHKKLSVVYVRHNVILIGGVLVSCLIGLVPGGLALRYYKNYEGQQLIFAVVAWYMDNTMGALLFMPFLCCCHWTGIYHELFRWKMDRYIVMLRWVLCLVLTTMSFARLVSSDIRIDFLRVIINIPLYLYLASLSPAGLSLLAFGVVSTNNALIREYESESARTWSRFYIFWSLVCHVSFISVFHSRNEALRNIEDRVEKRTEELNQLRQAAIETSVRKAEFLSYISHEIRNPVHAIGNMIECIASIPDLPAEAVPYIENLRISNTFILDLVTGILDIGKVEMNKFTINIAPIKLKAQLSVVITHTKAQCSAHSIRFEPPAGFHDLPEAVETDGVKLQQMLYNLISNAIKYTGPGGVIRLKCKYEWGRLTLAVTDTGVGIPAETMKHLFEPYVQASSAKAGTGLGLAICKVFAEKLGGSITVQSTLNVGSTFTLDIPAKEVPVNEPPIEPSEPILSSGTKLGRVLVVDDERVNRMILKKMLSARGYVVFEAEDGLKALRIYEENKPFAYIFSDMHMPEMDGLQLRERIQDTDVTFIIVSGDALPPNENYEILMKPFTVANIESILRKHARV